MAYSFIQLVIHSIIHSEAPSVDWDFTTLFCSNWGDWLSCQWCKLLLSSGVRIHYTAGRRSFSHRWPESPELHYTFIWIFKNGNQLNTYHFNYTTLWVYIFQDSSFFLSLKLKKLLYICNWQQLSQVHLSLFLTNTTNKNL